MQINCDLLDVITNEENSINKINLTSASDSFKKSLDAAYSVHNSNSINGHCVLNNDDINNDDINNDDEKKCNHKHIRVISMPNESDLSKKAIKILSSIEKIISGDTDDDLLSDIIGEIYHLMESNGVILILEESETFKESVSLDISDINNSLSGGDMVSTAYNSHQLNIDNMMNIILPYLSSEQTVGAVLDITHDGLSMDDVIEEGVGVDNDLVLSDEMFDDIPKLNSGIDNIFEKLESKIQTLVESNKISGLSTEDIPKLISDINNLLQDNDVSELSLSKKEDMIPYFDKLSMSNLNLSNPMSITKPYSDATKVNPIITQIISNIRSQISSTSLNDRTVELRLKLFPSKLGGVSIMIQRSLGSINVQISSDNPEVRNLLNESIHTLKDALENNGEHSVNIDVSSGDAQKQNNEDKKSNTNSYNNVINSLEDSQLKVVYSNALTNKILDIKM